MPRAIPAAISVKVVRKWLSLAKQRKAHLIELYESGRWRLYYTDPEFIDRLREAISRRGSVECDGTGRDRPSDGGCSRAGTTGRSQPVEGFRGGLNRFRLWRGRDASPGARRIAVPGRLEPSFRFPPHMLKAAQRAARENERIRQALKGPFVDLNAGGYRLPAIGAPDHDDAHINPQCQTCTRPRCVW